MKYEKPELTYANAASAIQGVKNDPTKDESIQDPPRGTVNAYVADE